MRPKVRPCCVNMFVRSYTGLLLRSLNSITMIRRPTKYPYHGNLLKFFNNPVQEACGSFSYNPLARAPTFPLTTLLHRSLGPVRAPHFENPPPRCMGLWIVCSGVMEAPGHDTYIHTYIHTYMHTYIHTYIHTCLDICRLLVGNDS